MKNSMKEIKCAGCGKSADYFGYDEDNDNIYEDGSYDSKTKQFVCDMCYSLLIPLGLDIGTPSELISNIKQVKEEMK